MTAGIRPLAVTNVRVISRYFGIGYVAGAENRPWSVCIYWMGSRRVDKSRMVIFGDQSFFRWDVRILGVMTFQKCNLLNGER